MLWWKWPHNQLTTPWMCYPGNFTWDQTWAGMFPVCRCLANLYSQGKSFCCCSTWEMFSLHTLSSVNSVGKSPLSHSLFVLKRNMVSSEDWTRCWFMEKEPDWGKGALFRAGCTSWHLGEFCSLMIASVTSHLKTRDEVYDNIRAVWIAVWLQMIGKGLETDPSKGGFPSKRSAERRLFHVSLLQGLPGGSHLWADTARPGGAVSSVQQQTGRTFCWGITLFLFL